MSDFSPLILVPSFNTGGILRETVAGILGCGHPVCVVVDGSTDGSDATLPEPCGGFEVLRLADNQGKGAAVLHGVRHALGRGFTHVLTMDADGQHPAASVAAFMDVGRRHPEALVLGRPVFEESAPALRVNGRKVSNFWTNLETLGWGIDDSLFGMRLYPARDLLAVMEETRAARRFDFDPEVAVRLAWRGVPMVNLATPVRYPSAEDGGISQFRYLRDNRLLTWMHIRLLFGFFARAPYLAMRGRNPLDFESPPHD